METLYHYMGCVLYLSWLKIIIIIIIINNFFTESRSKLVFASHWNTLDILIVKLK